MEQYIDKFAVVAEIEKIKHKLLDHIICESDKEWAIRTAHQLNRIIWFINTLEVKEVDMPVLDNRKMSVERWKEACKAACSDRNYRSHYGFTETRDDYFVDGVQWADEHPEIKEVDLEKEIYDAEKRFGDIDEMGGYRILIFDDDFRDILRHFFELGLKAQKGE